MKNNLLFLTLRTFSLTGGIEKVTRVAGKALFELCSEKGWSVDIFSMYDRQEDNEGKYFPKEVFSGFGGNKARFILKSLQKGKGGVVILSHINLLSVGYAIKKLSPKTKVVLIAHGIEVWSPLPVWKKAMLQSCDLILPVSQFTKEKMLDLYGLAESKCKVINNCLDPFLPGLPSTGKSEELLQRYGLRKEHKILLTLTRLASTERYKGYDEVIMAVKSLKDKEPLLRYLIVGKYDKEEKARLDKLIHQQGLQNKVILTGFVPDSELANHFGLAEAYIMPSRKEGFGIVFIEAMYYGKPVIGGCIDGTVDALANGRLGVLIHPDKPNEIIAAINSVLLNKDVIVPSQLDVMQSFSFPVYKKSLDETIHLVN